MEETQEEVVLSSPSDDEPVAKKQCQPGCATSKRACIGPYRATGPVCNDLHDFPTDQPCFPTSHIHIYVHMSATGLTANGKYRKIDTNYAGKKLKILGRGPDYWALHPTTGLFTRLFGFSPDDWAFHPTTGLFTRRLGFAPDDWALHPTTGLCT